MVRKFQKILPRPALLTIYKHFIRTHLDYGDIIYNQAFKKFFLPKIESPRYNATLAITEVIRGTSKEKSCQELGLESPRQRLCFRNICFLFKIYKGQYQKYFF